MGRFGSVHTSIINHAQKPVITNFWGDNITYLAEIPNIIFGINIFLQDFNNFLFAASKSNHTTSLEFQGGVAAGRLREDSAYGSLSMEDLLGVDDSHRSFIAKETMENNCMKAWRDKDTYHPSSRIQIQDQILDLQNACYKFLSSILSQAYSNTPSHKKATGKSKTNSRSNTNSSLQRAFIVR